MTSNKTNDLTLRLSQTALGEDRYRVEIATEGGGKPRQIASSDFIFKMDDGDQRDIRWYLENYLQDPHEPAPTIAARTEKRMTEIGTNLFKKIFHYNDDTKERWIAVRDKLSDARVEIATDVKGATAIPWELMRDPKTEISLALSAQSFVRASSQAAQTPKLPDTDSGPIRILLVICRPGGSDDVPFRSVASRLVRGLEEADRKSFQLDVLRPPTFEALSEKLRAAYDKGKPYHVVHFDGHGIFFDVNRMFKQWEDESEEAVRELLERLIKIDSQQFSPKVIYPNPRREGQRGYLIFDNQKREYNFRLVDGPELGKLLWDTGVPVLVLNACQSAFAEVAEKPESSPEKAPEDVHAQTRAYGSLAQEITDAGVAGVVAMRYSVYVVTAAQFVADLYAALARGQTLGQAVTLGRKQLKADPMRTIAYDPLPLQDWCVPLVFEAAPIRLFPELPDEKPVRVELKPEGRSITGGEFDPNLPKTPDVGFFGRDETLQALDQAFNSQPIILLHAYAGSGKTTTAAEFARWYSITGGIKGLVLFTSFERYKPLPRVLDDFSRMFAPILEKIGVHWSALGDAERRDIALQVLQQVPVLWIWDNIEPVKGFPKETDSAWSKEEQDELVDFLRDARNTKAKFLLTSRRDEQKWLVDLPRRITIPPMPMQESVQLARAIAEKHGRRLTEINDWRPLLRYTKGNPLTITVIVGQALRAGIKTREQVEAFVEKLSSGEAAFEDDESEGRSKSLGASLRYGFDTAFNEEERKILAMLYLFQGFVDVDALKLMGNQDREWHLPELRDLTREKGIELLDRAAEVGLLTEIEEGAYSIHPAVPWFSKRLFDAFFPGPSDSEAESSAQKATRAFVETLAALGNYYHNRYAEGNRDVITFLAAEEINLLHARRLARANGWWRAVISTMQGIFVLYDHTGRWVEWKRLVEEIVPDFADVRTDDPLPGREEEEWGLVMQYRVYLARQEHQLKEAERLQKICVEWGRKSAAPFLNISADSLNDTQRNSIRSLAASLQELGEIQRELGKAECEKSYKEALGLSERIGEMKGVAICAFSLGHAYLDVPVLRNLNEAERLYQRSLKLHDKHDRLGQAKCIRSLGLVAIKNFFSEAQNANKPKDEALRYLNKALQLYSKGLDLTPENAVYDMAVTHNQLGQVYRYGNQLEKALHHYNKSIQYKVTMGDIFSAAGTRFNVALALASVRRFADALLYAQTALRDFETFGGRAAQEIEETKQLIAQIEKDLKVQGSKT